VRHFIFCCRRGSKVGWAGSAEFPVFGNSAAFVPTPEEKPQTSKSRKSALPARLACRGAKPCAPTRGMPIIHVTSLSALTGPRHRETPQTSKAEVCASRAVKSLRKTRYPLQTGGIGQKRLCLKPGSLYNSACVTCRGKPRPYALTSANGGKQFHICGVFKCIARLR
jgi:hypothetical protein